MKFWNLPSTAFTATAEKTIHPKINIPTGEERNFIFKLPSFL
jgi:hypothetical protein